MKASKAHQESGVALFLVIIALLLVTAVAAGMISLSNTEINVDSNYRDEQVALLAAKAGLEEARDRLLGLNPNPITPPTVLPGASGGPYASYIIASGASPWSSSGPYEDTEYLSEMGLSSPPSGTTWYTSTATNSSYSGPSSNRVPYQWVRINLKIDRSASTSGTPYYVDGNSSNASEQVCYDTVNLYEVVISAANCSAANSNYQPVYVLTSCAVTPNGSHRMLQQEVTSVPLNLTLPGALTIDGPIGSTPCGSSGVFPGGSTCNSGGNYISGSTPTGADSHIAACASGSSAPAIAVTSAADQTALSTALAANKSNIVGTGGSPSVGNASSALANLSTPTQIETLVSQMKSLAGTNVGCDYTKLNLGTAASPTITVVTNDGVSGSGTGCPSSSAVQLNSGSTGYGILVVTGTLDYVNVNSYQGIILMLGTAQFISSSSKDTTLSGALFLAQDRDPSTGALLASLGTPNFNFHHGSASASDVSIQFDQCITNQVQSSTMTSYKVLSQRELMF
jgi:Tfp pilus assembly protein PilX